MYFLSYFFMAIAKVLDLVLTLFMWIVIARTVLSWINPDPFNPFVKFIREISEPVIRAVHSRIPSTYGGIDFSPLVIFLCIIFLKTFVINSLIEIARSLI